MCGSKYNLHIREKLRTDSDAYQELNNCAYEVDVISSEKGIRYEASKEGKEEGSSHEIGDIVGRFGRGEVHVMPQIQHQIACIRQIRQVLQRLHRCTYT